MKSETVNVKNSGGPHDSGRNWNNLLCQPEKIIQRITGKHLKDIEVSLQEASTGQFG